MDILLVGILLAAAFYVGWNIGANDAANCIGTTVGAQIISYRKAATTVDGVCNKAEACFDFFLNQMPEIPEEYRSEFCASLDLTAECFAAFHKALEAYFAPQDKLEKVRQRDKDVGELESRIDKIERDLTARIFRSSLDLSEKIHMRHALRRISDISDATENSADELELVSLKSIV